ncbi:MAG TPA: hypothetical protein VG738_04485 [Chitinophagaceae bacterium]|nr:hypothetical protein [Chitinophagaceae bacterium]
MSVAEMKEIIHQQVEQNQDEVILQKVLDILAAKQGAESTIDALKHIKQLFAENDGLLKRLA